jgi:hypothetical protein
LKKELWDKIVQFELDDPNSEYGFSERLANENFWTKEFTELTLLEYKKFMYLAATAETMVSPSEIVDTVWHQHLIYTQSYQEFCNLLGKQIQHIPSTHNKEEFEKFKKAKERTKYLYSTIFGEQPKSIWEYKDMYASLNLEKAAFKLRTFLIFGILGFITLLVPFYYLLQPLYIKIDNPYFLYFYIGLIVLTYIGLDKFNKNKIKNIVYFFDKESFIYYLQPFELVYLKTQKISDVINGVVNELVENKTIFINADQSIQLSETITTSTKEQLQVTNVLDEYSKVFYPLLHKRLVNKPPFLNIVNCMDAFKKYFNKSKKFGTLFYINFGVLTFLLMLGGIRLIIGLEREKPVTQLAFLLLILVALIVFYLYRLTKLVCTKTLPELYKNEILPKQPIENNWQWNYFLYGSAVLITSFIPLANHIKQSNTNNSCGTSCGTGCASACGSSCGGGCGGCGGD